MATSEERRNNVIRSIQPREGHPETDLYVPLNAAQGGTTGGPANNYGATSRSTSQEVYASKWRSQDPPSAKAETASRRRDLGRF